MNKKVFKTLEETKKYAIWNGKYWNIAKIEDPAFISGSYKDYFWFQEEKIVEGQKIVEDFELVNTGFKSPFTIPEQINYDSDGKVILTIPSQKIDLNPTYQKVQKSVFATETKKNMEYPKVFFMVIENMTGIKTPEYDLEKVQNLFYLEMAKIPTEKQNSWVLENRDKILKNCENGQVHFNPTKGEIKLARISSKNITTKTETTFTFTIGDIVNDLLQITNLIKK